MEINENFMEKYGISGKINKKLFTNKIWDWYFLGKCHRVA